MALSTRTAVKTESGLAIGGLFHLGFSVFRRNCIVFVILGGLIIAPYLWVMFTRIDYTPPLHQVLPDIPWGVARYVTASRIAGYLLRSFGEVLIIKIAHRAVRGVRLAPSGLFRAGLAAFLPVTMISLIRSVCLIIGDILLQMTGSSAALVYACLFILPGLIIVAISFVAPQVCVIEGLGTTSSLLRSVLLTRGNWWKILGIYIGMSIPALAAGTVANRILAATGNKVAYAALEYAIQGLYVGFSTVMGVVTYDRLRTPEGGPAPDRIVAVFE